MYHQTIQILLSLIEKNNNTKLTSSDRPIPICLIARSFLDPRKGPEGPNIRELEEIM